MLWEIESRPLGGDAERERVREEFNLLAHGSAAPVAASARGGALPPGFLNLCSLPGAM